MSVDKETFSFTIGAIAAAVTAIGIVYSMVSGSFPFPNEPMGPTRWVVNLAGPPLIGAGVAFLVFTFGIGRPIYYLMTRKATAARKMQFAVELEAEKQRQIERERARERRKADEDVARQKRAAAKGRGGAKRRRAAAARR